MTPLIVRNVEKTFTMHLRDGLLLPVVAGVNFEVEAGECVVLGGPSGAGKSSLLKMVYGNYSVDRGEIIVVHHGRPVDLANADPRTVIAVRRDTVGYVSQFLRTVRGVDKGLAQARARDLLARLNLPERLWSLPPATFSGGEQQRVNIARGFITDHSVLLLDEPTASLDATNRAVVVAMIAEKQVAGTAMLGIFHDDDVRTEVADRIVDVTAFAPRKQAA